MESLEDTSQIRRTFGGHSRSQKGQIEPFVQGLRLDETRRIGGHLRNLEDAGEAWRTQAKSEDIWRTLTRRKGQMGATVRGLGAGQRTLRKLRTLEKPGGWRSLEDTSQIGGHLEDTHETKDRWGSPMSKINGAWTEDT